MMLPLSAACLFAASIAYQIPPDALYGILRAEGGALGRASVNRDGSRDLGPFQINSAWLPQIATSWRVDRDTALRLVRDDGCANAGAAAAILAFEWTETGDLVVALGRYHSHNEKLAEPYRRRVLELAHRYERDLAALESGR